MGYKPSSERPLVDGPLTYLISIWRKSLSSDTENMSTETAERPTASSSASSSSFSDDKVSHQAGEKSPGAHDTITGDVPHLVGLPNSEGREDAQDGAAGPAHGQAAEIPLRYRLLAFSMILFFATGSSFMQAIASPLKSTFRKKLGITSESTSVLLYCRWK